MSSPTGKRGFAARPVDAEGWIKAADVSPAGRDAAANNTARLTVDITPALRGRIKVAAFRRGQTVADMLRGLLAGEFPDTEGDQT